MRTPSISTRFSRCQRRMSRAFSMSFWPNSAAAPSDAVQRMNRAPTSNPAAVCTSTVLRSCPSSVLTLSVSAGRDSSANTQSCARPNW